jgi:photosystem II stability/assembly factor-like uncharacterized protein
MMYRVLGVVLLFLAGCTRPAVSPSLQWAAMNEGLAGTVGLSAVVVAPGDPHWMLAATLDPVGLYRSEDGGVTWRSVGEVLEYRLVHALLAPADWPDVVLAATSDGLYRSPDGGRHWEAVANLPLRQMGSDPTSQAIYALAAGPGGVLYLGGEGARPLASHDGGQRWEALSPLSAGTAVLALASSPAGDVLLAGTDGAGVQRSTDGGQTWARVSSLPTTFVSGLWFVDGDGRQAFARTRRGLFRSQDGGLTWQAVAEDVEGRIDSFAANPLTGQRYVATNRGLLYVSEDGISWQSLGEGWGRSGSVFDLVLMPRDPEVLLVAVQSGLYRSDDNGRTWQRADQELPAVPVADMAQDSDSVLLAATGHGVFQTTDQGDNWMEAGEGLPPANVLAVAISPADPMVLFAGTEGAGLYHSQDGGRTWQATNLDVPTVTGLLLDPEDAGHVLAIVAFERFYESFDGGATWRTPWQGLDLYTEIVVLALRSGSPHGLYAGGTDGLYGSGNGGTHWQRIGPELDGQTIFVLVVDAGDPDRLYAGASKGVYRSEDGGQTWQRWGEGLSNITVTALALHPTLENVVYAGTKYHGLYRSGDGGRTWLPANDGLDASSVNDLVISPDGQWLMAATPHGIYRSKAQ